MGLKQEQNQAISYVDVLVLGAGPSGLMTALWMAELGIKTRIIDKRGTRALNGRADGIHVRSMEIYESFDMVDPILKHGFGISEWCLWGPDEDGDLHRKQRKCALGTDLSRFPITTMHQGHIEAAMISAIRQRSGAMVERGTVPVSIEVDDTLIYNPSAYPVKVNLRRLERAELEQWRPNSHTRDTNSACHPVKAKYDSRPFPEDQNDIIDKISGEEGSTETVYAKYVVGADGAHSWTRQHLGLKLKGDDKDTVWGVADLRPVSNFPDIRKNCTIQSESGTVLIVPRENGMVRIYLMLDDNVSDDTALAEMLNKVKEIMTPFKFDYNYCDWWTVYRVAQKVSDTYSHKNRVYFVGDAAHTLTPKGGQGMNVSIQDAYNLGWKLGMVLKGSADQKLLNTYEKERRPIAQGLIEMETDLSRLLASKGETASTEDTQRIYERLRDYGSGVNIQYEPSIVNVEPAGPTKTNLQVGKRFPSFQVYSQATSRPVEMQQLLKSDGRWRLIVVAGAVSKRLQVERINTLGEELEKVLSRYTSAAENKSLLEVLLVHTSRESEVEINDFHNTFFNFDAEKGGDYNRVFTRVTDSPHGLTRSGPVKQGLSFGTECMVLLRPDQHVGWMGRLDDIDLLEEYLGGFMISTEPTEAPLGA